MRFGAQAEGTFCMFVPSVIKQGPMRQLFLLLLLLQVSAAIAGEDKPKKKPKTNFAERVKVGLSVSPGFSYRWLHFNKAQQEPYGIDDMDAKALVEVRNGVEAPFIGLAAGPRITITATRFLTIETGVDYANYLYRLKKQTLNDFYGTPDSIYKSFRGLESYHYINIPVGFNFNFGKRKVQGLVSVGANINVLVKHLSIYKIEKSDGSTERVTNSNYPFIRVNVSPFLGIGMQYNINPLLQLRVMPVAYMQAMKNIHTPITEHLYGAALNVALFFAVKKKV